VVVKIPKSSASCSCDPRGRLTALLDGCRHVVGTLEKKKTVSSQDLLAFEDKMSKLQVRVLVMNRGTIVFVCSWIYLLPVLTESNLPALSSNRNM